MRFPVVISPGMQTKECIDITQFIPVGAPGHYQISVKRLIAKYDQSGDTEAHSGEAPIEVLAAEEKNNR